MLSQAAEHGSMAVKVFLAQFMNTGIVTLLLSYEVPLLEFLPIDKYSHPDPKWYALVVSPLAMTMVIQFIAPCCSNFGTGRAFAVLRWFLWSCLRPKTQNGVNALYTPQNMKLASHYGETLLGFSVTVLFATAMPIMYFVGAFGFTFKFWGDKYCVLREFRSVLGSWVDVRHLFHLSVFLTASRMVLTQDPSTDPTTRALAATHRSSARTSSST